MALCQSLTYFTKSFNISTLFCSPIQLKTKLNQDFDSVDNEPQTTRHFKILKLLVKYVILENNIINIFDLSIDLQHSTHAVNTVTDLTAHAFDRLEIIHPAGYGVHLEDNLVSIPVKIVEELKRATDRRNDLIKQCKAKKYP